MDGYRALVVVHMLCNDENLFASITSFQDYCGAFCHGVRV
jgi:hypothetical protein